MKKLHLDFLVAFSKMEGKSEFMSDLINEAAQFINDESYMKAYVASYNQMMMYGLESEIKYLMDCGYTFLDACLEWDILDEDNAN
jgi:hypothetical protein